MIKIRSAVFETNSSSQHSLVIKKTSEYWTPEEIKDDFHVGKDGSIRLYRYEMEYGRSPFNCLSTFREKWIYCLCALTNKYGDEKWDELEAVLKKHVPEVKTIVPETHIDMSKMDEEKILKKLEEEEAILAKHGIHEELNYWTDDEDDWKRYEIISTGYAEDYGMIGTFLKEENISIEEFLLNKKYIIIVDGDEYCIWGSMKESGIINEEEIEREYA